MSANTGDERELTYALELNFLPVLCCISPAGVSCIALAATSYPLQNAIASQRLGGKKDEKTLPGLSFMFDALVEYQVLK